MDGGAIDAAIGCFIEEAVRLMVADAKGKGTVRLDDYSMWKQREVTDMQSGVGQFGSTLRVHEEGVRASNAEHTRGMV